VSEHKGHTILTIPLTINIATMAEDEDIAALVIDNGSGMCKGRFGEVAVRE
jgi:hypothetical protein